MPASNAKPSEATSAILRDALRAEKTDVPHILRPRAALGEILALCATVIAGAEPCKPKDRRSLIADADRALGALGKHVKRELQPAISNFRSQELRRLSGLLEERGGTVRLRYATNALDRRLLSTPVAVAAWRDLVEAATNGLDIETCRLHALQLRELDEARGHEWIWRRQRFLELIGDGAFKDCEEVVGLPPSRTAEAVWIVFDRANIGSIGPLRVGQVQFFPGQLIPKEGESITSLANSDLPPELDEEGLKWLAVDQGVEGPLVYARVEMTGSRAADPANPWAQGLPPADWARRLVDGIVKGATFRLGGSAWKLLDGEAVYHGTMSDKSGTYGNWGGAIPFEDPLAAKRWREFVAPPYERTGTALEELDPSFAENLARGKREAAAAVKEVQWFESAEEQAEIGQRLMLRVRAFERALPTTATWHWDEAVKYYLREFWALEELNNRLFFLAHKADRVLRHQGADVSHLEEWIVRDRGGFTIHLGTFLRVVPELLKKLKAESDTRVLVRQLRLVASWDADPHAVHSHLERLAQNFDTLLARALRQRNSIVHGLDSDEAVIASVDGFVSRLAAMIVAQAVHGAAGEENLVEALAQSRDDNLRILWRLNQRDQPVSHVLFREPVD
jgi:Txe/YoeB family toxin of Txe-Axe toxin-antitoxin module